MKSRFARLVPLFAIAALFLAGCAEVPRQAFNAAAAGHIKKVVVTQQEDQDEYDAFMVGHPAGSFGLIGGLVAAADMQAKTTQLTKALDAKEVRLQQRFGDALSKQLKAAGYEPEVVKLPKDAKQDQALSLARQHTGNDAVLMIELRGGYWAAGPSSDYFPRVIAKVKAVDAKTEKTLYEDTITYGYNMPQAKTVHLASDASYRFKDMDALVQRPEKTREGLYAGVEAVTQQIVSDLRRQ